MECFEITEVEDDDCFIVEHSPSTEQIVNKSEDLFPEPCYQPSLDDCSSNSSTTGQSGVEKEKAVWLNEDCRLFITLYREEYPNLGKTPELKTKGQLWQRIAERMHDHGTFFTASQVQIKWNAMQRAFKKTMKNKKQTHMNLSDKLLEQPSTNTGPQTVEKQLLRDTGLLPTKAQSTNGSESSSSEEEESLDGFKETNKQGARAKTIPEELQMWRQQFTQKKRADRKYRKEKLRTYKRRTSVIEQQMLKKHKVWKSLLSQLRKKIK